jgi:hypothetical protein
MILQFHVAPCAEAIASTSARNRASPSSRFSGDRARTVPLISAVSSGMTLCALPAWNCVTETTMAETGSAFPRRDRLQRLDDLRFRRRSGRSSGSAIAACPPRPVILMRNSSVEAKNAPGGWQTLRPAGSACCACRRRGRCRSGPSARRDHGAAAAAALFGRLEDHCHRAGEIARFGERYCAAPSSMEVWPSWPQACILPGTVRDA